jgi:hypothetical protein
MERTEGFDRATTANAKRDGLASTATFVRKTRLVMP